MPANENKGYVQGRIDRLRGELSDRGMDAMYVRDASDVAWLTAFQGVFDGEDAHAVYVDAHSSVVHTDSRYSAAFEHAAKKGPWSVDSQAIGHAKWLSGLIDDRAGSMSLGIDQRISLGEFRGLEKDLAGGPAVGVDMVETDGLVLGLRAVKDEFEISRLRAAQAITDAAFAYILTYMKPGMTERQVQVELEDYMLRHGASGLAFSSIVATGANGASPHCIPGDSKLEAGQCVVMDFGARAGGYCSDMTRVVFLGQPDARMKDAYVVLREANESVERMLRPGVTGAQAHQLALDVLEAGGFGGKMGHSLGHGVGIDVHEQPVLSPRNERELVSGNVVTVEPGIYLEGQFGMRLEDCGVITDDGFQVFTQSSHDMSII